MIKALLVDIEGTISPISFVKNVMFPYSERELEKFLKENKDKEEIKKIISDIKKEIGEELTLDGIIEVLKDWIHSDKKISPLKELQGYIWEAGFKNGELKAPIYEDAYQKLKEWKEKGFKIYIYSSGSVKAQKLFFSHSEFGNILNIFDGHFDTKIGNKKDKSSYFRIADQIGLKPDEILFLSDNSEEIVASIQAGMKAIKLSRPNDTEFINDFPYPQVKSFKEINL